MTRASQRPDGGPAEGRPPRPYAALRHYDFRLLWGAELVSGIGTQAQRVAIGWQVYDLTGDAVQLGLLGLARFFPLLLLGLAGGVLADRGDRRRLLLVSQVVPLLGSAALGVLTLRGQESLLAIYAVTVVSAAFAAVGNPTRQALVPSLVPTAELAGAMTMTMIAFQVAAVSGPALGGLAVGSLGVAAAYLFDAATFVIVIGAVLAMRSRPTPPPTRAGGLAAAVEGLRFLRDSPVLLGVMGLDFLATFFGASTVLMPIFAEEVLGVGAEGLGLLLAAPAAGAVAASLVIGSLRPVAGAGRAILVAVAAYGACILGFGLSEVFWLSLVFLAGSGAADAVSMALRHAIRVTVTPDPLRGRVAAAHSTFAMGGPQLGEFESGVAAGLIGAGPAVALGGAGTLATVALIATRFPALARYRFAPGADEPAPVPGALARPATAAPGRGRMNVE